MNYRNVVVDVIGAGSKNEIEYIVDSEIQLYEEQNKEIASVRLIFEEDEVTIESKEKSPIRRVRRITGYLSQMEKFNDAKQDELSQRYKHM